MSLSELEAAVARIDALLKPIATRPVDINDPGWQTKLRLGPHPAEEAGVATETGQTLRQLLILYADGDDATRADIRALFARYTSFRWAAHLPAEAGFRLRLLHWSAVDLGADTRDAWLALAALVEEAKKTEAGYAETLREVAALSTDDDHHGMGSARHLLHTYLPS